MPLSKGPIKIGVETLETGEIAVGKPQSVTPEGKYSTTCADVKQTKLFQNYPNPLNPETWIPYQLAEAADVVISIYNVNGHITRVLNLGMRKAGAYLNKSRAACWDGKDESGQGVSSGIYFYRIEAGDFSATRKMAITR